MKLLIINIIIIKSASFPTSILVTSVYLLFVIIKSLLSQFVCYLNDFNKIKIRLKKSKTKDLLLKKSI